MKAIFLALLFLSRLTAVDCWQKGGVTIIPKIAGSTPTAGSNIGGITGVSGIGGINVVVDSETSTWITRIVAISASAQPNTRSVWIARNLIWQIKASAYDSGIIWFLPLLGPGLASARVPLRDTLAKGAATFTAFSEADYSQGSGLQANGSTKWVDSLIKASELGTSNSGGIAILIISAPDNTGTAGGSFAGMTTVSNVSYFSLLGLATINGLLTWGSPANGTSFSATAATAGDYYGERSSSTSRQLFKDGSSIGTNTTSDTATQANLFNLFFIGFNNAGTGTSYKGVMGYAALTDGTLGATNAAAFHTLVSTYLIATTGR